MNDNLLSRLANNYVIFFIGVVFISFNLRPAITAVGPLIDSIRASTGLSTTAFGLLTTLPVLAFGLFSFIAPKIGRMFGNEIVIFVSLVILIFGIVLRSLGIISLLFIGTLLIGFSIAICNVLITGVIKDRMPQKIGIMTAVYTMSMSLMASLASGLSIPLAENLKLGWEKTLLLWGALVLVALVVWFPQLTYRTKQTGAKKKPRFSLFRSPVAWQITFFMGCQSSIFYCLVAWFVGILVSQGIHPVTAGWLLTLAQISGMIGNFVIPQMAVRLRDQRSLVLSIATMYMVGLFFIYITDHIVVILLASVLFGVAQGAGISLALTLFSLRSKSAVTATNLSGLAQSGGYLFASIGPFFMGFLYDISNSWVPAFLLFAFFIVGFAFFGYLASRDIYVDENIDDWGQESAQ